MKPNKQGLFRNELKQLQKSTGRLRLAFLAGMELTTYSGNRLGGTVDFRKIVSNLRKEGLNIVGTWRQGADGRRFKTYKIEKLN